MNGKIIFNVETGKAMCALLKFLELEWDRSGSLDHVEKIMQFKEYCEKEELTSAVIMKCNCPDDITNRELIFNVCLHCKGVVDRDFLQGFHRRGNTLPEGGANG